MTGPLLGLALAAPVPPDVRALLAHLEPWVAARAWSGQPGVRAVLADADALTRSEFWSARVPLVLLTSPGNDAELLHHLSPGRSGEVTRAGSALGESLRTGHWPGAGGRRPAAVLSRSRQVARAVGPTGLVLPAAPEPERGGLDPAAVLAAPERGPGALDPEVAALLAAPDVEGPVTLVPFVRTRLRAARGLPAELVALEGRFGWEAWTADSTVAAVVPPPAVGSLLALAGAVVARALPAAVRAVRWGAPLVAAPAVADRMGLEPAVDVVVGPDGEQLDLARGLVADPVRAAGLSRSATRWTELAGPSGMPDLARRLAARLALPGPVEVAARLPAELDQLYTPDRAYAHLRAEAATAGLGW